MRTPETRAEHAGAEQHVTEFTGHGGGPQRAVLVGLAGGAAVLCALAVWFFVSAHTATTENTAFADAAATTDVSHQTEDTIDKSFSYNHDKMPGTEKMTQRRFSGHAIQQYNQLLGEVQRLAPQQNIVLTTKVQSVGVISLHQDQARLLIVANQDSQRAGTDQHNTGEAQFEVAAQHYGKTWKITNINLL